MRIAHSILLFILLTTGTQAWAQGTAWRGRVIDADLNEPLEGAVVQVVGSSTQTLTDAAGYFSMAASEQSQIEIRYLGYETLVVGAGGGDAVQVYALKPANISLHEVKVQGYSPNLNLRNTPASVAVLNQDDFARHNATSLAPVLNTQPGIQAWQSGPENTRLSVRGIGTRSQSGVRGIKVYFNDIPLTEADGFTRLEGIDLYSLGRAEVIKGPASSLYGPANGGVLNLGSVRASYDETSLTTNATAGSYNLQRYQFLYKHGSSKANIVLGGGSHNTFGYRSYNSNTRTNLNYVGSFYVNDRLTLHTLALYMNEQAQNPGQLTQTQWDADAQQEGTLGSGASARLFSFYYAGRLQSWVRMGIAGTYQASAQLSASLALFGGFYDNKFTASNQFVLNGTQMSYGARGRANYSPRMASFKTTFTVGGEYQYGINVGVYNTFSTAPATFGQLQGLVVVNANNVAQRNDARYLTAFAQTSTRLTSKTILELGASYNKFRYAITDYYRVPSQQDAGVDFAAIWRPRVGLSHQLAQWLTLRGSYSTGFAPQLLSEAIETVAAGPGNLVPAINTRLNPETSEQYELGLRGDLRGGRLVYDLAVYELRMQNEIVLETRNFVPTFSNAASTRRRGVELGLGYQLVRADDANSFVKRLQINVAYTHQDFQYTSFTRTDVYPFGGPFGSALSVNTSYDGKRLPGTAPHLLTLAADLDLQAGVYLRATYYWVDKQPVNDINGDYTLLNSATGAPILVGGQPLVVGGYAPGYNLLNAKLGWQKKLGHWHLDVFVGLDNALNARYSGFTRVNDSNGAYYLPSMPTNYYVGLQLQYSL